MRENAAVPRVSVVIPAHNAAPYLEQTLASVRAQTHDDWEVVACDDGSTDGTWEISAQPATGSAPSATSAPVARQWRKPGAELATGEFAMFLDADDLILPRYLGASLPPTSWRARCPALRSGSSR